MPVVISWVKDQPPHVETRATKEQRWADMPKKAKKLVLEQDCSERFGHYLNYFSYSSMYLLFVDFNFVWRFIVCSTFSIENTN